MIGLMGLAGALSYLLKSKKGYTEPEWDDIIVIGLVVDLVFMGISLFLSIIPMGASISASFIANAPGSLAMPIPFWGILISMIMGFVEFIVGAIMVPFVRWISENL